MRIILTLTILLECDVTANGSCYWLVNIPKKFDHASLYCQSQGGTLAEVYNDEARQQLYYYGYSM